MAHPNARTTPRTRAEMVKLVKAGHSQSEVARIYSVSRPTVAKWVWVYDAEGPPGLQDHSSRPHHSPRVTPEPLQETICHTRQETNWGPNRIAWALGVPCSTVYAVLRRAGLHRRPKLPRDTHKIVRYEHERPGDLVHLDIKKLGRVPPGGGKRFDPGFAETHSGPRRFPSLGSDYLHVAVDDYSRFTYAEALPDERGPTAAAFLERAIAHFASHGVHLKRVLTDNGGCYLSHSFRATAAAHSVRLKRTRPYRPQTNGKAEAFIKILQHEWAYRRRYTSNTERLEALEPFLLDYNYHRPHGGLSGNTPASRL